MSQESHTQPVPSHINVSLDADTRRTSYSGHVGKVVVDLADGVTLYLASEDAAGLALALLRAASAGGQDVSEHVRDAAEECTDALALVEVLLFDLKAQAHEDALDAEHNATLVQAVREHAEQYREFEGWDVIAARTDAQILGDITHRDEDSEAPDVTTVEEAISFFTELARVWVGPMRGGLIAEFRDAPVLGWDEYLATVTGERS